MTFTAAEDGHLVLGYGFMSRAGSPFPTYGGTGVRLKNVTHPVMMGQNDQEIAENLAQTVSAMSGLSAEALRDNFEDLDSTEKWIVAAVAVRFRQRLALYLTAVSRTSQLAGLYTPQTSSTPRS